jgi:hypothetical protein
MAKRNRNVGFPESNRTGRAAAAASPARPPSPPPASPPPPGCWALNSPDKSDTMLSRETSDSIGRSPR